MIADKLTRFFSTFLVGILLVRYLGADQFGQYSYALSIAALFGAISSLGLDRLTVRELLLRPADKENILGTVFLLRLSGSALAFVFSILFTFFLGDELITIIMVSVISFSFMFQSAFVVDFFFQSLVKSKYSAIPQIIGLLLSSIIKLLLILFHFQLIWFIFSVALESLLIGIGLFLSFKFQGLKISGWRFNLPMAKKMLSDSWPLILSGIAVSVYMKTGQIMVKKMLNVQELGYYSAAIRICESWYFLPVAISNSLFPAIMSAKSTSKEVYSNRIQKLYDLMSFLAISIAIPITIFSEDIIRLLYGQTFTPASGVLTIYVWAGISVFLGVASGQFLIAENLTKISFYRTLLGGFLNIVLNYLLIPKFGITGSALATLISYSFAVFSIGFSSQLKEQTLMLIKSLFVLTILKFVFNKFRLIFK